LNGLAPSVGKNASSTVRVPPSALVELADEVEEVELVELVLAALELEDVVMLLADEDDTEDEEALEVGGADEVVLVVETVELVVVVFELDNAKAAAPAITMMITMTTAIITLPIADTFTFLIFIFEKVPF
jgi:hypothetical protein